MKGKFSIVLAALAAFAFGRTVSADTYDERLEYIETDGTQWADTGLTLNCRYSKVAARIRVLDYASKSETLFGGMTDKKDDPCGDNTLCKSFAIGAKPTGNVSSDKSLVAWNECSDQHAYFWPVQGSYPKAGGVVIECWRHVGRFNNVSTGYSGYESKKRDEFTANTYYIGACNNAGDGVLMAHPEEKVRVHWYRVQFWNNVTNSMNDMACAELVGDFIPVRQGPVIGFFDRVTETFHPSISGVAFTAPSRVLWTGGSTGSLTAAANWQGGAVPTESTQVAEFPAGVQVRYPTADIEGFFNKVGGVRLDGADTVLWLTNLNVAGTHSLKVPLFGPAGTFRVESKLNSASYQLKVYADNGDFGGLFDITNCFTYYCAPYAFGDCGVGTAKFHATYGSIRLYEGCGLLHADLRLGQTGQFVFAPGTTFDGKVSMVTANGATFHANGTFTTTFNCAFDDTCNTRRTLLIYSGNYVFGDATKPKNMGLVQVQSPSLTVGAPLTFSRQATDSATIYNQCNLALQSGGTLTFGCTNALSDETFLLLEYASAVGSQSKNIVNLNGFDQRVGILGMYANAFDASKVWNANLVIKSDKPATLTVLETFRCDANDGTESFCSVYPGRLSGAASLVLDKNDIVSPSSWTKRMRFNCPNSDTTGRLQANGGYIEIMPTATFSNLTALVATGSGQIKVGTSGVGCATNLVVAVSNATEAAKIELAENVTIRASLAYMGTRWLERGKYSSVAGEGITACSRLAGKGILEVDDYGGTKGFVIFFH